MDIIINFLRDIWNNVVVIVFSSGNNIFIDILDIAIVTLIIYKSIQFMHQTRAEQLLKGIFVFIIIYSVAQLLNLRALTWIVSTIYLNAIVVLVILFQPELRSILERMGRGSFKNIGKSISDEDTAQITLMIDSVCKACQSMQKDKIGALIVLERETRLGEIVATGTIIDATPSKDIICNIFFPNSPLHDGAVIIRNGKILAASCILPLTQNANIDSTLGTRHRAAIGISEVSDAIVVVVSEETGIISITYNGKIRRDFDIITLKEALVEDFLDSDDNDSDTKGLKRIFKRKGVNENENK